MKQILLGLKWEIESHAIILEDFNTPPASMDTSSRQKINKKSLAIRDNLDQMSLTCIYKYVIQKQQNMRGMVAWEVSLVSPTCKGGWVGANRRGGKGKSWDGARDTARSYCRSQPREGKNQVAAGIPFSLQEQRDTVSIPGVVIGALWLNPPIDAQRHSRRCWATTIGIKKRKSQSLSTSAQPLRAHLPSHPQS